MNETQKYLVILGKNEDGSLVSVDPVEKFPDLSENDLGKSGRGPFCRFELEGLPDGPGAFVFFQNGEPIHVGRTINSLRKEIGEYGKLCRAAFKVRGQSTHCRINKLIFKAIDRCGSVELIVWPTPPEHTEMLKKNLLSLLTLRGGEYL